MPQRTSAQAGSHHLHSVFLLCNFICILCARCFFLLLISINRPVNRILGPQDNMSVYFSVCFGFTRWQSAWVDLPSVHGRDSGGDETGCDEFDPRGGRGSRASGSAVCCLFYRWFVSSPGVILARAHPNLANLLDSLCQVCECLVNGKGCVTMNSLTSERLLLHCSVCWDRWECGAIYWPVLSDEFLFQGSVI